MTSGNGRGEPPPSRGDSPLGHDGFIYWVENENLSPTGRLSQYALKEPYGYPSIDQ